MAKVLFGFTQDLSLVLEVLAFHLDSRPNVFLLGKTTFKNLFGNALWLLENSFATFNNSFLPWPECKSSPQILPSSLDHVLHLIQQVELSHVIFPIQISFKQISAFYSTTWRFTKELHFLFGLLPPNFFPLLVL